jgi:hypothetical protein
MWRLRRVYVIVTCVAGCWLGVTLAVLPRLGDPVSFNKVSKEPSPAVTEASNQLPQRSFRGNVYHIVFDSYQSEAFQYFLDRMPELQQLPFTYYPNFRANSWLTYWSMAVLFSGKLYTPDMSPESWRNTAFQHQGMMEYLANSGVQIHEYTNFPEHCYAKAADCSLVDDMKKELLGEGQARRTTLDMWFLKLIPTALKRELNARFAPPGITDDDVSFSGWDYGFSISDAVAPTKLPEGGPYFALEQYKRFLDSESSRPATGQYVFLHVLLPHYPFELDGDCNYVGRKPDQALQENYLEHVQCTNKLMGLLMQKLTSLGRLDNSLIIFQADHGYYWHPADLGVLHQYHPLDVSVPRIEPEQDDSTTWPSEVIETRASALLLVKFPGQSTSSRSDKPVQMLDLAPTILRYFDIHPNSMHGIPLQDMPESPDRERLFLASNYFPTRRNPGEFSEYRYVDGRWAFKENIVTVGDTNTNGLFTVQSIGH